MMVGTRRSAGFSAPRRTVLVGDHPFAPGFRLCYNRQKAYEECLLDDTLSLEPTQEIIE